MQRGSVFHKHQYGFRKRLSAEVSLAGFTEAVRDSLCNGVFGFIFFVDIGKAFDSVYHEILFKKLDSYRIKETSLKLLTRYLDGTKFYVQIGYASSQISRINQGIPQGSCLEPLLFLLYINELPSTLSSTTYMFTDDTTYYWQVHLCRL